MSTVPPFLFPDPGWDMGYTLFPDSPVNNIVNPEILSLPLPEPNASYAWNDQGAMPLPNSTDTRDLTEREHCSRETTGLDVIDDAQSRPILSNNGQRNRLSRGAALDTSAYNLPIVTESPPDAANSAIVEALGECTLDQPFAWQRHNYAPRMRNFSLDESRSTTFQPQRAHTGRVRSKSVQHAPDDDRREKLLERNRVAANKCRRKKREAIQGLKDRYEAVKEERKRLTEEAKVLRGKSLHLKDQVLRHSGCNSPAINLCLEQMLQQTIAHESSAASTGHMADKQGGGISQKRSVTSMN